jgi:ankyrin repeat protein
LDDTAEALLKSGKASVNAYDAEGTTALLLAMEQGDNGNGLEMMELLLRNNAFALTD